MTRIRDFIFEVDTRANQPDADAVSVGTLYSVEDEGRRVERSNGTTWDLFVGGVIVTKKAADENRISTTTPANDADFSFAIGANEVWEGELNLFLQGATAADFKYVFSLPSGASGKRINIRFPLGISSSPGTPEYSAADVTTATTVGVANPSAFDTPLIIKFIIKNGATPGTVNFQWAQNTSTASNTTLSEYSWMRLSRVA